MGQKVNPVSYRLQISKDWSSKWFTRKSDFRNWLVEDVKIRDAIEKRYSSRPIPLRILKVAMDFLARRAVGI